MLLRVAKGLDPAKGWFNHHLMLLVEAHSGFGILEVVKRLECMVASGKEVLSSVISQ